MSLLNDMLRDLSQHKPVADGAEGYDKALLESSSFVQKKQQPWVPMVVFFIAIFCGVILVKHFVFQHEQLLSAESVSLNQALSTVNNKSIDKVPVAKNPVEKSSVDSKPTDVDVALENTNQPIAQHHSTSQEMPTAVGVDPVAAEQDHVSDLLLQAERAISMDRLTSPIEDNAYNYYQKILTLSPNNSSAKDGLDNIASRYMSKAQEQINAGNLQQAQALIQRARFVSERYVQAHDISIGDVAAANIGKASNETSSPEPSTSETIKSIPVVEAQSLSVTPNAAWKDEQLAKHAQQLVQQGKQTEAMALLKNLVATEQKPSLSAALLTDLYIQQGSTQAANIVLEKATYLPLDVSTKLHAQLLVAQGDNSQAISLLEKNLASAQANESYGSLLASLYHTTANYQQSVVSYQVLLNSFGEKPAYWLGLALAYDGLGQAKNALQAYKRLGEFPQLQDQVKKYTDQRIAALSGE